MRISAIVLTSLAAATAVGCVTRSVDVAPLRANPAEFAAWRCDRIDDELDAVQQRAVDVAYAVDQRAGNNILALGVGVTVFWPAMLAMRPDGLEAADLARLKGRFEALIGASRQRGCPPPSADLPATRAALLPVAVGERLVYEDRAGGGRGAGVDWVLQVAALRRGEIEFTAESVQGRPAWRQDLAGNITAAPPGALRWARLLKSDLALGQVLADDVLVDGDPWARARLRGQVVALGPQTVADRRFDAAVIELFGDAPYGSDFTRVDGSIVVDRASGVLLRLDLRSANPAFTVHRRLLRVEQSGAAR